MGRRWGVMTGEQVRYWPRWVHCAARLYPHLELAMLASRQFVPFRQARRHLIPVYMRRGQSKNMHRGGQEDMAGEIRSISERGTRRNLTKQIKIACRDLNDLGLLTLTLIFDTS